MQLDTKTKELIALGASLTAHCQPCLRYHLGKAREAGAGDEEITMAIAVAKAVRRGAAAKMDDFVMTSIARGETAASCADTGCGCGA